MTLDPLLSIVFGTCPDCHAPLGLHGECLGITRLYRKMDKDMRLMKVVSAANTLYYVPSAANPLCDGWIPIDKRQRYVLPFVVYNIKPGKTVPASREEVDRYRHAMKVKKLVKR